MARTTWAVAALCLLLLAGGAVADSGKELQEKLQEAEEAQEFREEAYSPVVSDIIPEAPPAELANGDADVATTGKHICASPCRNQV
mmetsp:Transcript_10891/g.27386  ORF Transcript_10891/g.27386 Transcript_10891/m.27386 type:complete len:86 (+) Transcript_10891:127-384(+)